MLAKKQNIKQGVDILWIKPKELDKYWSLVQFMIAEGLKFDGNPMNMDVMKKIYCNWRIPTLYDVWFR